jgi:hypothetical protein
MRAAYTSLAFVAVLLAGCASMEVVNKTPEKKVVAEILRKEAACVTPAPDATEQARPCGPGDEAKVVRLSTFSCEALPLKTGVLAAARANCLYAGDLERVDGRIESIAATSREFQLLNLTPGIRRPIHEWSASPLPKSPAAKS